MEPTFFETGAAFRKWLQANHARETELLVGFWKVGSGKPSITWPQSVDEALCFGWIDGVRKSRDADSYTIRFTPRKPTSIWSTININKVAALKEAGLMQPAGLTAFELRKESRSNVYSYEKEASELDAACLRKFKAAKAAWAFFEEQPPGYRKQMIHRITDAKTEATRHSRLQKLIDASTEGRRLQ